MHLCEAFLVVPPNFPLFKSYFFLKYQSRAVKRKVIGGVGLQTRPHSGFLDLLMKTSLKGWHKSWFYYENHEPSLLSFIGRLSEYIETWIEKPTPAELPIVTTLGTQVSDLKRRGLTGVYVAANWLAHWVMSLNKQVHPGWEYSGLQDPTRETSEKPEVEDILEHLYKIFTNISSWPPTEQVCTYHIGVERDPIR
jgi:hypothetical protein